MRNAWFLRRLYAAPIYVQCVQLCNVGRGKGWGEAKNVAKMDTRRINRGPRKDVYEAEVEHAYSG